MAVTTEHIDLHGPAGRLEASLERNENDRQDVVAIICHPHPQFQGTMLNKVVHTLSRSCTDLGIPALRFNYRGVGASDGGYDDGVGETDDAAAAVKMMQSRYPGAGLVLAGFSFGSGVVLRLAQQCKPDVVITIAPPVGRLGVPENAQILAPWLVLQGTADELVDWREVQQWVEQQHPLPRLKLMTDVSHFFHGQLTTVRTTVTEFLRQHVGAPDTT